MDNNIGHFLEIQNFSVNDGNGIRTVVFFAGCPLRCQWCSNPESFTLDSKTAFYEKTCIGCMRCVKTCPNGVGLDLNTLGAREKCSSCGLCTHLCPTGSRKRLVHQFTGEEVLKIIEKQRIFYRYSGGGVTFSGGEATLQQDMLRTLTNELYDRAVSLAIETSGYFDFYSVKDILAKMDLIFVDIKHMDKYRHKLYTGVDNDRILENIGRMKELNVPVVVRIPVIDGVNADEENIRKTAEFVKANVQYPQIELLPYHSLGDGKYEALGLKKPARSFKRPTTEHLRALYAIIGSEGVRVVSYK